MSTNLWSPVLRDSGVPQKPGGFPGISDTGSAWFILHVLQLHCTNSQVLPAWPLRSWQVARSEVQSVLQVSSWGSRSINFTVQNTVWVEAGELLWLLQYSCAHSWLSVYVATLAVGVGLATVLSLSTEASRAVQPGCFRHSSCCRTFLALTGQSIAQSLNWAWRCWSWTGSTTASKLWCEWGPLNWI